MNSIVILAIILALLCGLYTYMYFQMKRIWASGRPSAPNLGRSLLEIIVFIGVYFLCSYFAVINKLDWSFVVTFTFVGFLISIATFNHKAYRKMGKNAAYMSVVVLFAIYTGAHLLLVGWTN